MVPLVLTILCLIALVLTLIALGVLAVLNPLLPKLALHQSLRSAKKVIPLVLGVAMVTAVIGGSFIVGDTLDKLVDDTTIRALGNVDLVYSTPEPISADIYTDIEPEFQPHTDGAAPVLYARTTLTNTNTGEVASGISMYGIDDEIFSLGKFTKNGKRIDIRPTDGIVLNKKAAEDLDVKEGDEVSLLCRNLGADQSCLFSRDEDGPIPNRITVTDIIDNKGLGALDPFGSRTVQPNAYLSVSLAGTFAGTPGKINMILLSIDGSKTEAYKDPDELIDVMDEALTEAIGMEDAGIFTAVAPDGTIMVSENDVYFTEDLEERIMDQWDTTVYTSYFVDGISYGDKDLSYSLVTGFDQYDPYYSDKFFSDGSEVDPSYLGSGTCFINNWTAEHLGLTHNDVITIKYTFVDELYSLQEAELQLQVFSIIDIAGMGAENLLMPDYEGISGVTTCAQWEPPFPVDMDTIEDEDEEYWELYEGTPKIFMSLFQAEDLFSTVSGTHTGIRIITHSDDVNNTLAAMLGPEDVSITVDEAKKEAYSTTGALAIFTGMFLTFGVTVVIAALLLEAGMLMALTEERKFEHGVLRALGMKRRQVVTLLSLEGAIYSLIGSIVGTIAAIGVGAGLVWGLNNILGTSVENNELTFYFTPQSLIVGFCIGFVFSVLVLAITAIISTRSYVAPSLTGRPEGTSTRRIPPFLDIVLLVLAFLLLGSSFVAGHGSILITLGFTSLFMAVTISKRLKSLRWLFPIIGIIAVLGYGIIFGAAQEDRVTYLLVSGLCLTILSVSLAIVLIMSNQKLPLPANTALAFKGLRRRPTDTTLSMTIVAMVVFLIASMAVVGALQTHDVSASLEEMSGGYDIIAQSTVAVDGDLKELEPDLFENVTVHQIKTVGQGGGTCSNMNARYPPRLIGLQDEMLNEIEVPMMMDGGKGSARDHWLALDEPLKNGNIPMIADTNTLVWIYGGTVGDVFEVTGDDGNTYKLEVIGIAGQSIFAGMFMMSVENIETIHPASATFDMFVFASEKDPEAFAIEIEKEFATYGMDARLTEDVVRDAVSFELSYMTLFNAYLGLGAVLGMAAVGVRTTRALIRRKRELAILRAVGYKKGAVTRLVFTEFFGLGMIGVMAGVFAGVGALIGSLGNWDLEAGILAYPAISLALVVIGMGVVTAVSVIVPLTTQKGTVAESIRSN